MAFQQNEMQIFKRFAILAAYTCTPFQHKLGLQHVYLVYIYLLYLILFILLFSLCFFFLSYLDLLMHRHHTANTYLSSEAMGNQHSEQPVLRGAMVAIKDSSVWCFGYICICMYVCISESVGR